MDKTGRWVFAALAALALFSFLTVISFPADETPVGESASELTGSCRKGRVNGFGRSL